MWLLFTLQYLMMSIYSILAKRRTKHTLYQKFVSCHEMVHWRKKVFVYLTIFCGIELRFVTTFPLQRFYFIKWNGEERKLLYENATSDWTL